MLFSWFIKFIIVLLVSVWHLNWATSVLYINKYYVIIHQDLNILFSIINTNNFILFTRL